MIHDVIPTDGRSVVLADSSTGTPLSNPKHELFAQRVAAGASYKAAYEAAFPNPTLSARYHASRLAHDPHVRGRVQQLTRAAAERASFSVHERMQQLADIAGADPGELTRVEVEPCRECWPDDGEALAAAYDQAAATNGPTPDPSQPRPSCERCGGQGVRRVVLTPTAELSAAGRRLLKSARQKADGSIEVHMHDQLAATRLLAELSGWLVTQNANLNMNARAPDAPAPVSADDALRAFHALRRVQPS